MKNFGEQNNITTEQEYSGLTITELEKKLVTEEPENAFKNAFNTAARWGRLLIVLCLAVILIYLACYIHSLKKEINNLRRELYSRSNNVTQAENTGYSRPADNSPSMQPGSPPQNEYFIYSIKEGDNLSTIAGVYYDNEEFAPYLAVLNNIPADSPLNVGQEIMVPQKPYDSWTVDGG